MKHLRFVILTVLSLAVMHAQDKPAGKFSGYMFGDYSYNVAHDSTAALSSAAAGSGGKDFNAFQLRRIYFTYDNDISSNFTTRFRLEGSTGSPIVKDAYLKWKNVFSGSDLYFGMQPTPAYDISEAAWGYRSLEKTIMDLRGIVSSRDLAISLRGKLDEKGSINYWVMFGNNSGTGAEADRYKRVYANVQVKPVDNLQVTLYADYSMKSDINNNNSTTAPKATLNNDDVTTALFVGYGIKDQYNVGVEAFYKMTANGNGTGTSPNISYASKNAQGISVFGSYNFTQELAAVARYDNYDPNNDSKFKGDSRDYILAGLNWKADKNVMIMPNVQYETYENLPNGGRSFDPSVTARVTFYYIFL
ncbi:MAG: hypothetical protein PHP42_01635 [Bacteroidota bacterium]|nr:hypothetical protein [Bacteroidota bacterium]